MDHLFELLISEKHLDIFNHVNNAAYLQIFEEARWDWIARNGFGRGEMKEYGVGPVILEVRMRFHKEVANGERVLIRTRTVEYRGKLGRLEQVMRKADGHIACTAHFVIGLFDLKARKLIKPTPQWLKAINSSQA